MATQYPEGFEPITKPQYPEGFEPIAAPASFTTGTSSPATDLAGLGFNVPRQTAERIAAQRLVARNRAYGFNDLLTRAEASQLAEQAGIPVGDIGEVVSTGQFQQGTLGDILRGIVGTRAAASSSALNVPGAVGKIIEDLVLNEAQKRVLGSQEMAARAPQEQIIGTTAGTLVPTRLIPGAVAPLGATLTQRVLQGAKVGVPVGAVTGAATTLEEEGLNTELQDLLIRTGIGGGAGGLIGGGISGVLGLPGAIKGAASKTRNALDEKVDSATRNLQDSIEAKQNYEAQLGRDVESATIKRNRAATEVAQEQEARALEDTLQQEQLLRAEQEAEATGRQALAVGRQVEPQIDVLREASAESPELVGRITRGLPEVKQPSEFGEGQIKVIEKEYQAAKKITEKDYDAIKRALPDLEDQSKLEAPNLREAANRLKIEIESTGGTEEDRALLSLLTRHLKSKPSTVSQELQNIYNNATPAQKASLVAQYPELAGLGKGKNPTYNWDNLQGIFQRFGEARHKALMSDDRTTARAYGILRDAIDKDMENYASASGTEVKSLFDKARANYVAREEKFGTARIQPLLSETMKAKPNLLVQKIIDGNNAPVVNNLKEILPEAQFKDVQAQYVDYLFSPSEGVGFDPNHFVKQFEKVNRETREAVFGKEGSEALTRLSEASKGAAAISELQKISDEASNIAQKAADDFQKAQTKAQERAIQNSFKSDASKQLDEFDAQLEIVKERTKDAQTLEKLKSLDRMVDDARSTLEKAKNPGEVPKLYRILGAVSALTTGYMSGNPELGILAAAGTLMTGEKIGRNIITPVGIRLLNGAAKSKADSQAARELSSYLTQTTTRLEAPDLTSFIDQSINKNKKKSTSQK